MSNFNTIPPQQTQSTQLAADSGRELLLWQSFRDGDRTAFSDLMNLYYPVLLNYGVRLQSDREFVKDCLHDLFIDLWNQRQQLDEVQKLKPYLMISLRRRLFRETKRLRWFREAEEVKDDYSFEVQFAIESYLVHNEVQHEDLKRLSFNLAKLSKRQREAIYLRFYQEMEYEDIARVMTINYHSVVNLVYEALRLLRKNWFLSFCLIFSSFIGS